MMKEGGREERKKERKKNNKRGEEGNCGMLEGHTKKTRK